MKHDRIWRWALVAALSVIGVGILSVSTAPVVGRNSAAVAPACCVAAIDLNRVLANLDEKIAKERELEKEIQSRESKVNDIREKARLVQQELELLVPGSAEFRAKSEEFVRLSKTFDAEAQIAQAVIGLRKKEMELEFFNKISEAAARYAQREGYQIVLIDNGRDAIGLNRPAEEVQREIASRRVIYVDPAVDLSDAVALMMNNEFKARPPR